MASQQVMQTQVKELNEELDRIKTYTSALQRQLILQERRLDVLARILGYKVFPFHLLLIEARRRMRGPWRLFLAPRGFGKSTILTIVHSVALTLWEPEVRILFGSRAKDQAKDMLSEVKGCYEVPHFCELFGDMRGPKWGEFEIVTSLRKRRRKEPTILATGADGAVTSKHFEYVKADDLVDQKNSRTEGERMRIKTFFYRTLVPCLMMVREDGRPGEFDLIGTRYNPDDIYGHVIENDPKFTGENTMQVPALYNPRTGEAMGEGEEEIRAAVSVCEELAPAYDLKSLKISMGSADFDSQFQQSVDRLKGDIFKDTWWQYYDEPPVELVRERKLKVYSGSDLAIEDDPTACEYADVVIGVDDSDLNFLIFYVLSIFHKRLTFHAQTERIASLFDLWDPIRHGVESNGYQKAQLQNVMAVHGAEVGDRCVPVRTQVDKASRGWKLSAKYEAGRVYHRRGAHGDLEKQLLGLPKAKFNDIFDALDFAITTALKFGRRKKRERPLGVIRLSGNSHRGRGGIGRMIRIRN